MVKNGWLMINGDWWDLYGQSNVINQPWLGMVTYGNHTTYNNGDGWGMVQMELFQARDIFWSDWIVQEFSGNLGGLWRNR